MVGRRCAWFHAASCCALALVLVTAPAQSQQLSKEKPPPAKPAMPVPKRPPQADLRDAATRTALIDKMIADYDLTPHPCPPSPTTHHRMRVPLSICQYVVEPPDLLLVEVLEALPGRPISGERLVRPDGKISLGLYGEVQVRGLTLPQIKVAIIKQLRKFLSDEMLGLAISRKRNGQSWSLERPPIPGRPGIANPFTPDEAPGPDQENLTLHFTDAPNRA